MREGSGDKSVWRRTRGERRRKANFRTKEGHRQIVGRRGLGGDITGEQTDASVN